MHLLYLCSNQNGTAFTSRAIRYDHPVVRTLEWVQNRSKLASEGAGFRYGIVRRVLLLSFFLTIRI
jgi:hypothetical protein